MKRTIIVVATIAAAALSVTALAQRAKDAEILFHRGVHLEEAQGDLKAAIAVFEQIVKDYPENRPLAAKAYYHLGVCYEKLGRTQATDAFKAIVEKYPDQTETVLLAREKLSLLAKPEPAAEEASEELKISLVWQGEGMDSTGEISPDGKYLSFVDWSTSDLAIRDMATGEVRRLTSKESLPQGPYEFPDPSIWAPDSRKIAYVWYRDGDFIDVRVVGLDDSKPRVLFRGDYFNDWVQLCDWSPDGRYILAKFNRAREHGGPSRQLGLVSVQDGSVRYLDGMRERGLNLVKFSPDGRYLVYDHPQEGNPEVFDIALIALEGGKPIPVIGHQADDRLLGWAPDGGSILFLSDRTGTWDAWMIRVTEGKPQGVPHLVKRELGRIKPMGLTQSGSLYYSTPGFQWDIFSAALDPNTGKLIEPPKKVPLLFEGQNTFPSLSPDGRRLAYVSERPGKRSDVLCVFSFESGETLEIQPKGVFQRFVFPHWMPDGSSLLVSGEEVTRGKGVFKVDLQTGELTDFLNFNDVFGKDQAGFVRGIRITDDARSIYYLYHGPEQLCRVMTRRLDSRDEKEICRFPLHDPSDPNRLRLSPDETKLALALRDGEDTVLKVSPASSGEIREILRTRQTGGFGGFVWSQDGRYIYFIKPVDPEHDEWKTALWRIPSSGGNPENLGLTSNHFVTLCVHPDGKRIFYASRTADEPGGAAIWAMENFLPAAKPKDIVVRRVFQDIGTGIVGSPSPDGRSMSDIDRKTGNLVVRELASGSVRPVTNAPGVWDEYALYSVFSADGKKLAYTWLNKEGMFEIRTIALDGTGVRTVLGGVKAVDAGPLGWSSDGRKILAFIYRVGGISEIVLISAGEGSSRVIKKLDGIHIGAARLSPDGRYVAYDRVADKPARSSDIFLIPAAGGEDLPLVRHEAMDKLLGWTPDGKGILFASDRTGSFDAWFIGVADGRALGDPVLVRKGLGDITPLGFDRNGSFFYGVQAQGFDVHIASVDVEAGKVLSPPAPIAKRYVGSNDSPGWSQDGKTLAYVLRSASASQSLLCLRSMESGEERDLALKMYVRWPQWSPDGRRILVWGRKDPADYGYYFVDPQTGTVSPFVLNTEAQSAYRAVWSPDGKAVYFIQSARGPEGESRLIRRDVETGRETVILRNTLVTGIAVSPDGRNIAFRSYDDPDVTLMIMPSSGGDIEELVRVKKPDVISMANVPFWTPDGRYLLYPVTRVDKPGEPLETKTELWRLDIKTREAKSLGPTVAPALTLAIHPDGKRIAFDSGMPKIEIWVMENFLDKN